MRRYSGLPTLPPDPKDAVQVLLNYIELVENRLTALVSSLTVVQFIEPPKPREGDFAFADGRIWNPGAGRGLYQYVGGFWVPAAVEYMAG